jgi:hypothetical protein
MNEQSEFRLVIGGIDPKAQNEFRQKNKRNIA